MTAATAKTQDTTPARREPMTTTQWDAFVEENQGKPGTVYNAEACRFTNGDRVRVVKPGGIEEDSIYYSDAAGHVSNWCDMDAFIGTEHTLEEDLHGPNGWHLVRPECEALPFQLAAALGGLCSFTEDWLEPVEYQ